MNIKNGLGNTIIGNEDIPIERRMLWTQIYTLYGGKRNFYRKIKISHVKLNRILRNEADVRMSEIFKITEAIHKKNKKITVTDLFPEIWDIFYIREN